MMGDVRRKPSRQKRWLLVPLDWLLECEPRRLPLRKRFTDPLVPFRPHELCSYCMLQRQLRKFLPVRGM